MRGQNWREKMDNNVPKVMVATENFIKVGEDMVPNQAPSKSIRFWEHGRACVGRV